MESLQGLVGGIQKFSTEDGPGIRTTVFLKGCPLKCRWCHNPELISFQNQHMYVQKECMKCGSCVAACINKALSLDENGVDIDEKKCMKCFQCAEACYSKALRVAGKKMSVAKVMEIVVQDKGYYKRTGGGMTISGGEMLSQSSFAEALLNEAVKEGIGVALDTSGFGEGEKLYRMAMNADYILYDIKCIVDHIHKEYTGVSNQIILENLKKLASNEEIRKKVWIRMPMIQQVNDTKEVIDLTCDFLKDNKLALVTILPYHELGISKYRSLYGDDGIKFTPPDSSRLHEIQKQFTEQGIETLILGEKIK